LKILNEIIHTLSAANPKLIDCLTKTKVLLFQIGRKDLVEWVNNEINGYGETCELPIYRVVHAQVKGNVANLAYLYPSHPLPTRHLSETQQKNLHQIEMRESIGVLENLVMDNKHGFSRPLPIEVCQIFDEALTGGYTVQKAWCDIGSGQIDQILIQVRSRLLDFLLDLKEILGSEETEEGIKEIAKLPEVASTFTNAIYGNNNTILVGNQNRQQIYIEQTMGDFTQLESTLRSYGVSQDDIDALKDALEFEPAATLKGEKQMGPKVGKWMKEMLSKAVDATWQVELGVAAGLLTTAIQKFYGWQ
jgi:hypothetical protein